MTCVQPSIYAAQATRHSSSETTERSEWTAFPIAAVSGCMIAVEPEPTVASSPPVSAMAASVTVATLAASHP